MEALTMLFGPLFGQLILPQIVRNYPVHLEVPQTIDRAPEILNRGKVLT
jgi:hypothetical protein